MGRIGLIPRGRWLRTPQAKFVLLLAVLAGISASVAPPAAAADTLVVDDDGFGTAVDCNAATAAFTTIGAAIGAATNGDVILVCPGIYIEKVDFAGKAVTLRSTHGAATTILNGAASGSVVTFSTGEGPGSVLEGFTITNGHAGAGGTGFGDGGGIRIWSASPTIRDNRIIDNRACNGAGISIYFASPLIERNTISGNRQSGCSGGTGGGGILIQGAASARIVANTISNNTIEGWGGGISMFAAGTPTIERNVISGNSANEGGGLSLVNQSDADIVGNLIVRNAAASGAGVSWLVPSGARGPRLVNNTLAGNDGPQGSAIFADGFDVAATLANNVIVAKPGQAAVSCGSSNDLNPPVFDHNDVFSAGGLAYAGSCTDQTGTAGNISVDPQFADTASGDYHLKPASPAIDSANNAAASVPATDIDGDTRLLDGTSDGSAIIDMGADEFLPLTDPPPVPTVTAVAPGGGPIAGGTFVIVTGKGFVAGQTTVTVGGAPATGVSVTSGNSLTATTPAGVAGPATVAVTTSGGSGSLVEGFTYHVAPTITSVVPNSGPAGFTTSVTITGTGFVLGQTTMTIGGAAASSVAVISATSATALTPMTSSSSCGSATVTLTTPGGSASLTSGFTFTSPPTATSIVPVSAPVSGGTTVTVTGTCFVPGQTTVTIGGNAATNIVVGSSTSLTCTTPPGSAGWASVVVTTPLGEANLWWQFSYYHPGPTATSIFPNTGPFGGGTTVTITGTGFVAGQTTVKVGGGDATNVVVASDTTLTAKTPPGVVGPADVLVTTPHGTTGLAGGFTYVSGYNRYLAEGATSTLFDTRLALLNVGTEDAIARLIFLPAGKGPIVSHVPVPARTRVTVDPKTISGLEVAEFSTTIETNQPLVVDRTMSWTAADRYGAHAETAVAAPRLKWYFAEGATHSGFNLFYLLQNPNAVQAQVKARFLRTSGPPLEKTFPLAPNSRTNIWADVEEFPGQGLALANTDVSAVFEVLNGQAIIVERAMYFDVPGQTFGAGHESAGVTAPALQWFLAEGATGPYFDLFILVANPGSDEAQVEATFLLPDGTTLVRSYEVAGSTRFNIWVDLEDPLLADTGVSTTIRSTNGVPVVVERAMWWPGPTAATWAEAHNAPGATETGTRWALAEGEVDAAREMETYVLIANTSAALADVKVTLLFEDGTAAERTFTKLAAKSRFNVPVGEFFPSAAGKRFGTIVESLPLTSGGPPAQIVVERAMYWNALGQRWAAGTDALATRLQ